MCPEKSDEKPLVFKAGNTAVKIYRYKSRHYPRFVVAYYVGGRRRRNSFSRLSEAKQRARGIVSAIKHDQLGALQLTNADRQSYEAAIGLLKPLQMSLHAAVGEYASAKAELNGYPLLSAVKEWAQRRSSITEKRVREVVSEFLTARQRDNVSQRYLQTVRYHANRFAVAFETNISSITSGLIDEWIHAQHVGPQSRNNIRQTVVTLFRFARSRGYLPRGQTTEADEVPRAKVRSGKIGILAPAQLATLLQAGNSRTRLYLAIGAFTGLRSAEITRLDWRDVNLARGHIEVGKDKAKTATRRLVPIRPNLMRWLATCAARREGKISSERIAKRSIALAKQILGAWPANALRHSYATYRLAQCCDAPRVALEMGNSPQILFGNYRELADEQDAAAWFSIVPEQATNVLDMPSRAI